MALPARCGAGIKPSNKTEGHQRESLATNMQHKVMNTLTLPKLQTVTVHRSLNAQFVEAKAIYQHILAAEKSLLTQRDALLILAFRLGNVLTDMKEEIGHGKWLFWLGGSWPALGERNAQRCMALVRDNPDVVKKLATKGSKSVESSDFTDESVRKFMWGYVPAKERLELPGDEDVNPQPHYLTFVNQYSKWRRQVKIGHAALPPIELMRRDFEPTVRDLIELLGRDWIRLLL